MLDGVHELSTLIVEGPPLDGPSSSSSLTVPSRTSSFKSVIPHSKKTTTNNVKVSTAA